MKKLSTSLISLLIVVFLAGCGGDADSASKETQDKGENKEAADYPNDVEENPIVTITMEEGEPITVELYPETAPNTVANFISLIEDGFYDGLIFHRIIPDFMIQGGDPNGDGTGGPDYSIKGEFSSNGFENTLEHDRGVLSMARSQAPDSAGSQFFIMTEKSPHLDGDYAAFGKVIDGMDSVDQIAEAERAAQDKQIKDQIIKKVEVDVKGYSYPEPEIQK